jgi:hypothetical protein
LAWFCKPINPSVTTQQEMGGAASCGDDMNCLTFLRFFPCPETGGIVHKKRAIFNRNYGNGRIMFSDYVN